MATETKLSPGPPRGISPKERDHIAKLILSNRTGEAVDLAKEIHKRERSSESEAVLLDAYGARLSTLAERNLTREAESLVANILERYPAAHAKLPEWRTIMSARLGNLGELMRELSDPSVSSDRAAAIHAELLRDLRDPGQMADCESLPAEHPLRAGARAVRAALTAVTSGPVTSEQIALGEVPRSSPLAPWKMLVRAIDAFHHGNHALCERCVAAIDRDSPAARLVPALLAMMGKPQPLSPAAAELVKQVTGGRAQLRTALERLDAAYAKKNNPAILEEIKTAVSLCRETDPDLARMLLQRISVRSMLAGLPPAKVTAAAGGMSVKDSRFWHLIARATEGERNDTRALLTACAMWAQFRKHAVAEGRFEEISPTSAAALLHIVEILDRIDAHTLDIERREFMRAFDGFQAYYRGQAPEIAAAGEFRRDFYFLYQSSTLKLACEADPSTANFEQWLRTVQASGNTRLAITVAEQWAEKLPADIPAWLALMQLAEERNALQFAFKYMQRAEQLDGLNAEVRRARLRLLIRIAVRHFRAKKLKLMAADLDQIDALPQAQQGDRPALFLGLRYVLASENKDTAIALEYRRQAAQLLGGEPAGQILTMQVESWCGARGVSSTTPIDVNEQFTSCFARVCALAEDLDVPFRFFGGTAGHIVKAIVSPGFKPDPAHLAALGEVALRSSENDAVHAVAAKGLRLDPMHHGRFLFLRARNISGWDLERLSSCIAAATELARRNHDSRLLAGIASWRERNGGIAGAAPAKSVPDTAEIAKIVQREIEAPRYSPPPMPSFERDVCQCLECRARRGEIPDADDDDFDDEPEFALPPGIEDLPPELIEMLKDLGPEKTAQMLVEMLDLGGPRPGRGKRPGRRPKRR